jgi:serine/threonine-protein kinase
MRCPACNATFEGDCAFCAACGAKLVAGPPPALPLAALARGGSATERGDPLLGTVLAERYRMLRVIGEGGMGRVYEAEHVNIKKRLAIKVLRPEVVSQPATIARFRQEARSASSIGHENIIAMDDFAVLPDGTVYLAMELLAGKPLGVRMREAPPLSIREGVALMLPVCDALAAAHDKGIIHRDMKPENIFLAEKGGRVVPKILDFGIAKMSGEEGALNLTQTGAIFGTPLYMSPEQASGAPTDFRTDIYSTGVILYELCTGSVPFKAASSVQVLNAHITTDPPKPRDAAPERRISAALEAVVLRAMAKKPEARHASMAQLAEDLREAMAEPEAIAVPVTAPAPVAPQAPPTTIGLEPARNKPPVVPIAIVLGLAIVAVAAYLSFRKPAATAVAPEPPEPLVPAVVTPPAPPPPPVEKPGKEEEVIVTTIPAGAKILQGGVKVAETPESVKIPAGQTMKVVLKKDGYVELPIVLDPSKGRKLQVKLERIEKKPAVVASEAKAAPAVEPPKPVPPPPPPPPPKPAAPADHLARELEKTAATLSPGAHRVGPYYSGEALQPQGRTDWYFTLEPGRCYTFVATAVPGVNELLIYLWGPRGNRVVPRAEGRPTATMQYCAQMPGMYHFQAKAGQGQGAYKMGIYIR